MLSSKSLEALKVKDENGLWDLGSTLIQVQGAILRMEQHTTDSSILRDLAAAAIDMGHKLEAILVFLSEKIENDYNNKENE